MKKHGKNGESSSYENFTQDIEAEILMAKEMILNFCMGLNPSLDPVALLAGIDELLSPYISSPEEAAQLGRAVVEYVKAPTQ